MIDGHFDQRQQLGGILNLVDEHRRLESFQERRRIGLGEGASGRIVERDIAAVLSDGGAWCDTIAKGYFHDATRILDGDPLVEPIWATAHVLDPDEAEANRWVSRCKDERMESRGIGLLRFVQRSRKARLADASSAGLKALDDLRGYLEPRRAITDYVESKAKGYAKGSGMMESTCKPWVGVRLKGSGRP